MAKIVLLLLLTIVVCTYAYPTTENEEAKDLIKSEVVRVERAASPVASADPYRGGGGGGGGGGGNWDHGYKYHGHHYPQQHNHYPKRGCHRCGHRG